MRTLGVASFRPDLRYCFLRDKGTNQMRGGIGAMTPLTGKVDADLLEGWRVRFVLHNHAIHLSDPALNGILAPSIPDASFNVNFAKSHGLPEARITNGINTVVIPAAAFDRFQLE